MGWEDIEITLWKKKDISHILSPPFNPFKTIGKYRKKTVDKVFLLRLLHYSYHSPQQHKLWNHIPLWQTLTLDSRTWRVLSHHYNFDLKTLRQLSDTVTRTIQMKPIVQGYQQRKHFHSHRRSPSPSTTSHLPISKSYIKGLNLMEVDIPWVTHQLHTMPTSTKKLKLVIVWGALYLTRNLDHYKVKWGRWKIRGVGMH